MKLQSIKDDESELYADGMHYNLRGGWYEFKCSCRILYKSKELLLSDILGSFDGPRQPSEFYEVVESYLTAQDGGNMLDLRNHPSTKQSFSYFVSSVATLYARMIVGDGLIKILKEMDTLLGVYNENGFMTDCQNLVDGGSKRHGSLSFQPSPIPDDSLLMDITSENISALTSLITAEVSCAEVIDLHTHLLPPSHGSLCLWGIDELLTYHYLVAEYFITAPASMDPETFYKLSKFEQADAIWQALFIDRSPISEACRGVVTTLRSLGLDDALKCRDLSLVRSYYNQFRDSGLKGGEDFCENVFKISGCKYAVMTNIPFSAMEVRHWRPKLKVGLLYRMIS